MKNQPSKSDITKQILDEVHQPSYPIPTRADESYVMLLLTIAAAKRQLPNLNTLAHLDEKDEQEMIDYGMKVMDGKVSGEQYAEKFLKIIKKYNKDKKIAEYDYDSMKNQIAARVNRNKSNVMNPNLKATDKSPKVTFEGTNKLNWEEIENKLNRCVELLRSTGHEIVKIGTDLWKVDGEEVNANELVIMAEPIHENIDSDISIHDEETIEKICKHSGVGKEEFKKLHPTTKKRLFRNYKKTLKESAEDTIQDAWIAVRNKQNWSDNEQVKVSGIWDEIIYRAKEMSDESGNEVRVSESPGFNNQGYYGFEGKDPFKGKNGFGDVSSSGGVSMTESKGIIKEEIEEERKIRLNKIFHQLTTEGQYWTPETSEDMTLLNKILNSNVSLEKDYDMVKNKPCYYIYNPNHSEKLRKVIFDGLNEGINDGTNEGINYDKTVPYNAFNSPKELYSFLKQIEKEQGGTKNMYYAYGDVGNVDDWWNLINAHHDDVIDNTEPLEIEFNNGFKLLIEGIFKEASSASVRYSDERKSPSDSATWFAVGTKKRGNDGNMWEIQKASNGVKRWVKVGE